MKEYLVDNVLHIKNRTADKWGGLTSEEVLINCRVDYKTKLIKNIKGNEVISSSQVILPGDYDIIHSDIIVINDIKHAIIQILKPKSFRVEFTEVYLS